jgi:hypothetical protein
MDGFVVLAGDVVFKDLLVGMELLLGHERSFGCRLTTAGNIS